MQQIVPELPQLDLPLRKPLYPQQTFKISAGLSLLMTAAAIVLYPFLQPVIPLFYTVVQPDQQLVSKLWLFLFPVFAWLVTLLHFSLLKMMKSVEGNIEKMFYWSTVGIIAITGLLFVRLILLVI